MSVAAFWLNGWGPPPAVSAFRQSAFRFRNDDESETAATWKAADNTDVSIAKDAIFRLRFVIQNYGTASGSTGGLVVEQSVNGGAWVNTPTTASAGIPVEYDLSPNVTDQQATTQQLGSGTFVSGIVEEGSVTFGTARTLPAGTETEYEYVLKLNGLFATSGDTIALRVQRVGFTDQIDWAQEPGITVQFVVSKDLGIPWKTAAPVAALRNIPWGIRVPLNDQIDLSWHDKETVDNEAAFAWDTRSPVASTTQLVWKTNFGPNKVVPAGGNWHDPATWTDGLIPGSTKDAVADATSGDLVLDATTAQVRTLDFTGYTGTFTRNHQLTVFGSLFLSSGMTMVGTGLLRFYALSGSWSVRSAGKSLLTTNFGNIFTSSATWTALDDITFGTLTLTGGTFDAAGYNMTLTSLIGSGTRARTLQMGSGTWTVTGTGSVWTPQSLTTINAGTSTLVLPAGVLTFAGDGLAKTYYNLTWVPTVSTDVLTISADTTFSGVFSVIGPGVLRMVAGKTLTFGGMPVLQGTSAAAQLTIDTATPGSAATFSKASGTVVAEAVSLVDNTATGGATWQYNGDSTVGTNVTGWVAGLIAIGKNLALAWAARTMSSDPLALAWADRVPSNDQLGLLWKAAAPVGDPLAFVWRTRSVLGDTVDTRWPVRAKLGDTTQVVWNTRIVLGDPLSLRWAIRTFLGDPVGLLWHLRLAAADSNVVRWHTRAALGDPAVWRWHTRQAVGDPTTLRWHTRRPVEALRGLLWAIRSSPGDVLGLVWRIRAVLGDQAALAWHAWAIQGDQTDLRWAIRTPLGDLLSYRWNTRNALGDGLALVWRMAAVLADLLALVWRVRSIVNDQAVLRWSTRNQLGDSLVQRWGTRAALGDATQLVWWMRALLTDQSTLVWHDKTRVHDSLGVVWNTQGAMSTVGDVLALAWADRVPAAGSGDMRWQMRMLIDADLALAWDMDALLDVDLALAWGVRTQVFEDLALRWMVTILGLASVHRSLTMLWFTKATTSDATTLRWTVARPTVIYISEQYASSTNEVHASRNIDLLASIMGRQSAPRTLDPLATPDRSTS